MAGLRGQDRRLLIINQTSLMWFRTRYPAEVVLKFPDTYHNAWRFTGQLIMNVMAFLSINSGSHGIAEI